MKIRIFILIAIALAFTMAAQFVDTPTAADSIVERPGLFQATLISPAAGQVVHPGDVVKVEWTALVPPIDPSRCETEIALSIDGGTGYPWIITPELNGSIRKFYWTVPNRPTNQAVLLIRYGCWLEFNEALSPQTGSMFVIAPLPNE